MQNHEIKLNESDVSNGTFYVSLSCESEKRKQEANPEVSQDRTETENDQELIASFHEINLLVKLDADKYCYVSNATIQKVVSQLPTWVLNRKGQEFIDMCEDPDFDRKFNLEFKLFDEFNLLGLKKAPSEPVNIAAVNAISVDEIIEEEPS